MTLDVSTYTAGNLIDTLRDDPWAVRNEAEKRHAAITKKITAAKARLAQMTNEAEAYAAIHSRALDAIQTEQAA